MRLGQGLVSTTDVRALQLAAIAEMKAISDLVDKYSPSDQDREAIRTSIRKIEGYTIPMAQTTPAPAPPEAEVPAGSPWWVWGLTGLLSFGLGAAVAGAASR